MGTAPLSKLDVLQPDAPYDRTNSKGRGLPMLRRKQREEPRTLTQLILLQDWQRVLVRAKLYPYEIRQTLSIEIVPGTPVRLLPLHLACALDPPVAVVTLFLKIYPDSNMTPVTSTESTTSKKPILYRSLRALIKRRRKRRPLSLVSVASRRSRQSSVSQPSLFRRLRRQRSEPALRLIPEQHLNAPNTMIDDIQNVADNLQEQSLLNRGATDRRMVRQWRLYRHRAPSAGGDSAYWGAESGEAHSSPPANQSELESPSLVESYSSYSMASSSRQSSAMPYQKGAILQLSPSGSVTPLPVRSQEMESSSSEVFSQATTAQQSRFTPMFSVKWDLAPLWESMARSEESPDGNMLPIHICVLYQASPAVVRALVDFHSSSAMASAMGMLPIHMVAAGWRLETTVPKPPPLPEPTSTETYQGASTEAPLLPYHHHHEHHPSRLKDILAILHKALPESTRIRSGQHGMTPAEYLAEAMEDGPQKDECLELLEPSGDIEEEKPAQPTQLGHLEELTDVASTNPSHIFIDSYDASRDVPWEISCSSVSSSPELGISTSVSIHSLLIERNWEGALSLAEDDPEQAKEWYFGFNSSLDPSIDDVPDNNDIVWKRLAVHIACSSRAPVGLVEVLLAAYPEGATSPDPHSGSLPLHLACESNASYRVIRALLTHAPQTTKSVDKRGMLPLHHAVLAKAHYAVIEYLVQCDPHSVLTMNQNQQTPLILARESYGKNNIIVRLLEMVALVLRKPTKKDPDSQCHHDVVCF